MNEKMALDEYFTRVERHQGELAEAEDRIRLLQDLNRDLMQEIAHKTARAQEVQDLIKYLKTRYKV